SIDGCQKNNYLVMVQTDDEVLNYQHAVKKYQHCRLIVEQGGDHSFVGFEQHLPTIANFFQLENPSQ
ncbi:MAG: YqiA/YcfP family alpha/beta fold hydrolase, partial [Colwellia sp.]